MGNVWKRKARLLVLITVLALFAGYSQMSNVSAATPTHTGSNIFEEVMFVGEEDNTGTYLFLRSITQSNRTTEKYFKPETCTVTSSDPNVLNVVMEALKYDPSEYWIKAKALSPGTAAVNFAWTDGTVVETTVQVVDCSQLDFGGQSFVDCQLNKGSTKTLPYEYKAVLGERYVGGFFVNETTVTSSNEKVVKVYQDNNDGYFGSCYLKAVGPGTAVITLTVDKDEKGEFNGVTKSFQVTVKQGPKATAPVLCNQAASGAHLMYNRLDVVYKLKNQNATYEIWRSTSPKKNFKKVGTIHVKEDVVLKGYFKVPGFAGAWEAGSKVTFDDYKKKFRLKANTKYYYKMRVKYTDAYYDNSWSKWSKVQVYWTPPQPLADSKIKFNKSSRIVKIPKVKNVSGYIYTAGAIEKLGYNVFGQGVYYTADKTTTTQKRSFKVGYVEGMKPCEVTNVIPYKKHGQYYYAHGYKPVKKLTRYKASDGHKFAS